MRFLVIQEPVGASIQQHYISFPKFTERILPKMAKLGFHDEPLPRFWTELWGRRLVVLCSNSGQQKRAPMLSLEQQQTDCPTQKNLWSSVLIPNGKLTPRTAKYKPGNGGIPGVFQTWPPTRGSVKPKTKQGRCLLDEGNRTKTGR